MVEILELKQHWSIEDLAVASCYQSGACGSRMTHRYATKGWNQARLWFENSPRHKCMGQEVNCREGLIIQLLEDLAINISQLSPLH